VFSAWLFGSFEAERQRKLLWTFFDLISERVSEAMTTYPSK